MLGRDRYQRVRRVAREPVTSALALTWANTQVINFNLACATATTDATLYQATALYVPAVP